jgi:hypothetical protein
MPELPPKPDYSVNIESVEPAYFKIVWAHGLRYRSYLIDKGDIETISSDIRAQLGSLVSNALIRDKAMANNDSIKITAADAAERDIMQELTRQCSELFTALFTCAPGSDADQSYVNIIRDQIRSESSPKSICFLVKARIYVPWGLLYDGSPTINAKPTDPDDFSGLWCLRHRVSVVFDTLASPNDFVITYDSKSFHFLTAGDNSEFRKAKLALKRSPAERSLMARLLKKYGRPAISSHDLISTWNDVEQRLGLLYLFCHADARTVGFSVDDTMSVIAFKNTLVKSTTSPRCLVFLNGCFTANPDAKGTFLEATGRDGFCGYIGAETEVPALFAFRFGLAFQRLLFQGHEVAEIMAHLLRKHWPLSLVYGLYAFPHLSITPNSDVGCPPLPDVNYSNGPLGEIII